MSPISDETREKIRTARARQTPPMLGRHHSDETIAKIKLELTGRHLSEEHRAKMRNRRVSEETRAKMREARLGVKNHNYGRPMSEATKAKIRAKKIGKHLSPGNPLNNSPENIMIVNPKQHTMLHGKRTVSEETRAKLRARMVGRPNPMTGRHHTEETKEKIRQSMLKRFRLTSGSRE